MSGKKKVKLLLMKVKSLKDVGSIIIVSKKYRTTEKCWRKKILQEPQEQGK